MRMWNLKASDPLSLTLAADARLVTTDYCNDHIWDLMLTGGDPPAIAIQTTFGLRARSFRLFPRFTEAGVSLSDPASFVRPPAVHFFSPNFVRLSFSPFADIEVMAEYWTPESHAVAGRLKITNRGKITRPIRFEWAAVLNPSAEGQRLSPTDINAIQVLAGRTDELSPVIFLTGGAEPVTSPYPALGLDLELPKETMRTFTWAEAALADTEASFNLARLVAARNWDAESARIELLNAGQVEIYCGESEWDAAFALAQKTANGLFCGPTSSLPAVSFVSARQPDYGYSPRGDGSDYNHLWNGQSPLEACYLVEFLLPAYPQLAQGVIRNFLATQTQSGVMDWKPGLGGQRSQLLATPLLAYLTWQIYQVTQEKSFLDETFPLLLDYFLAWFDPSHDRDGDGIPEWDHVLQTGFEDHPLFANWDNWSRGIDISTVESPSLCAFLFRECQTLMHIAKLLERTEPLLALQAHADNLKAAVEASWDDKTAVYRYWDRDTHHSPSGENLGERYGSGEISIQRNFDQPVRILVRIQILDESSRQVELFIHGTGSSGQHLIERITSKELHWYLGLGSATSERVYTNLEPTMSEYITQNGGVGYRWRTGGLNLMGSIAYQEATLRGVQTLTTGQEVQRRFGAFLPSALLLYTMEDHRNLRVFYRTSMRPPTIAQLQDVIDNSNPLLLTSGNPNLIPTYTHTFLSRYGQTSVDRAQSMFILLSATNSAHYIGNSTIIPLRDTVLANGRTLAQGVQLTTPANLDGYWNVRSFFTYGFPFELAGSTLNLNSGVTYTRTPGIVNGARNAANAYSFSQGFVVGSNISEDMDFTISYTGSYTIARNSLPSSSNSNYYSHSAGLKWTWTFWNGVVLRNDISSALTSGLSSGYNQDVVLWNISLAQKVFENRSGEVKLGVADLLGQNRNLSRAVTDTYVEDTRNEALQRYVMASFTYTFR